MYLKLGTIGVNYSTPDIDDFMIFSEVPDSSISYESPILVRTLEELEIWFGKSMLDYPQLVDILNHGGTLYLYGPTSVNNREDGIIDISNYFDIWLDKEEEIPIPQTLIEADDSVIPRIEGIKYRVENNNGKIEWWIWKDGAWLQESKFPQNMINVSESLNNRDTLLLSVTTKYRNGDYYWFKTSDGEENLVKNQTVYVMGEDGNLLRFNGNNRFYDISGIQVKINSNGKVVSPSNLNIVGEVISEIYPSHPKYSEDEKSKLEESFPEGDPRKNIVIEPYCEGNTYSLKITYPGDQDPSEISLGNGFFMFSNSGGIGKYAKYGNTTENSIKEEFGIDVVASGSQELGGVSTVGGLIAALTSQAEGNNALNEYQKGPGEVILYTSSGRPKFTFGGVFMSSNPDVMVEIDDDTNSRLLDQYIKSCNWPGLYFWSRTIGRDSDIYEDTRDISIRFESIEDNNTLVEISRYDYTETYIGKWQEDYENESLINQINQNSKLIRCEVLDSDLEFKLPEKKSYYLLGAVENKSLGSCSFWKSLETLLDPPGESVYPDFVLIPYLFYYEGRDDNDFKEMAEKYNTQFIISEKYSYQIEGNLKGDEDRENRVMYFYGDLKINGVGFPAAYPFITGILTNSSYYIAKSLKNTLDVEISALENCKCNYLESNNQRYFYKKYNSGDNYITTGWRRFIIGKISRELEKNKWKYLGTRYVGIIRNTIEEILRRVQINFSMIRDIKISKFSPDVRTQTIDMTVDVVTTDLVDNNVTLDIIINYNKQYE